MDQLGDGTIGRCWGYTPYWQAFNDLLFIIVPIRSPVYLLRPVIVNHPLCYRLLYGFQFVNIVPDSTALLPIKLNQLAVSGALGCFRPSIRTLSSIAGKVLCFFIWSLYFKYKVCAGCAQWSKKMCFSRRCVGFSPKQCVTPSLHLLSTFVVFCLTWIRRSNKNFHGYRRCLTTPTNTLDKPSML